MYLKKLELVGFKSFPEKTQFLFNQGITSIVGPNGCGKTNLLDALRWVLGEQKTSLLRGSKMEEVIFAGTRSLKPLGMAEVSLHVDNKDGALNSPYNEITVARRLFRSGDSEYVMNKVPCRLKDITDLFADTGVGAHAYAIIQQDMVDAILSDKNEERRFLFEEAAGITRYKHRKKAAERKLEATEHDLVRLKDILSEVETRVRSLKRQVNRARRYKEVSDELQSWDVHHARHRHDELNAKRTQLAIEAKEIGDKRLTIDAQLGSRHAEMEQSRVALTDVDRELSELSGRVFDLSEQAHRLETEISVNREKRDNLKTSAAQNRDEIEALTKRGEVIQEEKAGLETEITGLQSEIDRAALELEQAISAQKVADEQYLQYRSMAEDENSRLLDIEGRLSSGRTDSANIEEQTRDLQNETEQQNARKINLLEEKARRRQDIGMMQGQLDTLRSEISNDEQALKDKEKALEDALARADRLRDRISETSSGYEATLARKNLLAEMIEQFEGYASGVVAIFDIASRWVDITGTVADFLRPRGGYQAAIEAALGETAQYIMCSDTSTAREAVAYLREQKAGRATFLILERLQDEISRPELTPQDGVLGYADGLVDCDDRYRRVPLALLGRTVVCQDGRAARAVIDTLPDGYRVATLDGELLTRDGTMTGGASEELSLIGRKNEIESLTGKLTDLENQGRELRNKQAETTLAIGELRQSRSQLRDKLEDGKDKLSELTSRLKEEQFKINAAEEVITSIEQQLDQIEQKLDRLKHRQYSLALDFDQLDKEKENISSLVQDKKSRLRELEEGAHQASEDVNRRQVAKIEIESKQSHAASQRDYYDEMLADIAENSRQKQEQIRDAETSSVELTESITADEQRLKEIFERRQAETEGQQVKRGHRDELTAQVGELEELIKTLRRDREQLGDDAHTHQIQMTEINSRLEQLEERITNEYRLNIREIDAPAPDPELTPEQIKAHIEELREQLHRMGIVNMLALEEFEEQKKRQEFLSRQLDDLITAKTTLKSTIQKINQTARAMFLDTMHKARDNFKQMYQELFTGGEADVILEDESDPLESRIEIISRPRGKKPLTIAQLSGGERALTAIALLFALYMVKPSPFCFLDEIDAPLDDVNIGRFLKIVRKFSRQTQFIIITHNKITMEAADTLYGVTMEEPGVSKVVAVRFKKDTEEEETILELHYAKDDTTQQQAG